MDVGQQDLIDEGRQLIEQLRRQADEIEQSIIDLLRAESSSSPTQS